MDATLIPALLLFLASLIWCVLIYTERRARRYGAEVELAEARREIDRLAAIVFEADRERVAAQGRAAQLRGELHNMRDQLAPYHRLHERLGLVTTRDSELAVPGLDRLWHEDFPNARPIEGGMVKWSPIGVDQRSAGNCFLHHERAEALRARIMHEEMPRAVQTRIRQAKYPDGRVVEFNMDKPETWPPEIKAIGTRERAALEASPLATLDLARFTDARALDRVELPPADGRGGEGLGA